MVYFPILSSHKHIEMHENPSVNSMLCSQEAVLFIIYLFTIPLISPKCALMRLMNRFSGNTLMNY